MTSLLCEAGPSRVVFSVLLTVSIAGNLGLVLWVLWLRNKARTQHEELQRIRRHHSQRVRPSAMLGHEIRTPLTLVSGSAELLLEESPGALNDQQRKFVSTIVENSNQVIRMAEDFLVEAKLDDALFNFRASKVEMRALVRGVVRGLRRVHGDRIRLDSHGAPLILMGDEQLLRQALVNLVNNAARHAGPNANITVTLSGGDGNVHLMVSDDGIGMTPSEVDRAFTPFATGGSLRPGTGLGMMITQRIVEMHGGSIHVDTIPRRGTHMYVIIPYRSSGRSAGEVKGDGRG